jgi:hypothetical protein
MHRRLRSEMDDKSIIRDALHLTDALPAVSNPGAAVTVFTLVCRRHLPLYLISVKTLFHFMPRSLRVVAINDGTLGNAEMTVLAEAIAGIEIITAVTERLRERLTSYPHCARFLRAHPFGPKLLVPLCDDKTDRFLLLDADVLWLDRPVELERWYDGQCASESLYMIDLGGADPSALPFATGRLGSLPAPSLNAGLVATRRSPSDLYIVERVVAQLALRTRESGRWIHEQTAWSVLVATRKHAPLPKTYAMVHASNRNAPRSLTSLRAIHYSCDKRAFLTEGARFLLQSGRLANLLPQV